VFHVLPESLDEVDESDEDLAAGELLPHAVAPPHTKGNQTLAALEPDESIYNYTLQQ
jgi:hypothetical protein